MSSPPQIVCACGRAVRAPDVLQHGYFMTRWRPVWVYLKYRCPRCRMLGQKLTDYRDWDESALHSGDESCVVDAARAVLGEIADREVEEFSVRLRALRPSDLDALRRDL